MLLKSPFVNAAADVATITTASVCVIVLNFDGVRAYPFPCKRLSKASEFTWVLMCVLVLFFFCFFLLVFYDLHMVLLAF